MIPIAYEGTTINPADCLSKISQVKCDGLTSEDLVLTEKLGSLGFMSIILSYLSHM
jgi:hypothetical protein